MNHELNSMVVAANRKLIPAQNARQRLVADAIGSRRTTSPGFVAQARTSLGALLTLPKYQLRRAPRVQLAVDRPLV